MTIKFPEHLKGVQTEFHKKLKEKRMAKQITIIVKKPGEEPIVTEIEGSLQGMQAVVGGNIELMAGDVVGLPGLVDIWFNEEGKLMELPPNLYLAQRGEVFDILVGTAFFTSHSKSGETLSLPEEFHSKVMMFCKVHACRG